MFALGYSANRPHGLLGRVLAVGSDANRSVGVVNGSVSVALTPALHASFSLFHGLNPADFSLAGSASASLVATADASAGCTLNSKPLLAAPVRIATFTGAIGPIPVVVVLQGQIYVDGDLSGSATATSSVTASAHVTGGIRYQRGHGFSPIFNGPSTSFTSAHRH